MLQKHICPTKGAVRWSSKTGVRMTEARVKKIQALQMCAVYASCAG